MSDLATEAPARPHHEDAWKPWLAAGLWIGLIAFESTNWLSSEHTGSFLYFWLVRLFGPINPTVFEPFHHLLRKAGHVFGYAMLSFLLFRAWRATLPINLARWSLRWGRQFDPKAGDAGIVRLNPLCEPTRRGMPSRTHRSPRAVPILDA